MTTRELKTNFQPDTQPLVADGRVEIFQPESLAEVVEAVIKGDERPLLKPGESGVHGVAFQPRVMLGLLTYCYARQILSSSDVWSHLMRDAAFRKICQNAVPGPEWIRRFRDENRVALHECLTITLIFLARPKAIGELSTRVSELQISTEARRRIVLAACLDRLEMEASGWLSKA